MIDKFMISRGYNTETAEVVINEDGSFTIGNYGPYTIRNEPIDRGDYGWNKVSIVDTNNKVVMEGHVVKGRYTFGQIIDNDMYRAVAPGLWDIVSSPPNESFYE